ncbi:EamA family transporter [Phaeobacter gallaeciensis]|uniref:Permease n=1 Tax=Phaeobacter gallaeciensis TaxID=60890 RepID=A0AAD0EBK7_9RHOB|nr:DMT family transporter [Phaeobacter gallaeciensis]AHD08116.1 putative permease [Phaeobacter gallaeciensis DSM 26640]ATE91382.1 putative permease [Phaeobacter gallaeciensis]ATE95658.1 putative permease [Phaeobacter gallaeciensis]ATE99997.1 putative permease [Phaeobacter gallaeciensis]ATF04430.1 putative permease [Phaeobacter gallaeciensis]
MSRVSPSVGTGIALSLVSLALLGIMPIISNLRPAVMGALPFAFALSVWQLIFALPCFAVEYRSRTRGIFAMRLSSRQRRRMGGVAMFTGSLFGLSTYLYVIGVEQAGAANAAIAIQAYPLFAILWESLFLKRRKTPAELTLTALLLTALYYLGTDGTLRMSGLSPWFLLALGVPFLWSIAHVLIKEELSSTPITPIQVTLIRVAISSVFLGAVLVLVLPSGAMLGFAALMQPMAVLMGLVYFLELIVWFYAVRHIDVSLASSITTPWPALTLALSVPLLGDRIEPRQVAVLVVVVACIYGLTLVGLRRAKRINV